MSDVPLGLPVDAVPVARVLSSDITAHLRSRGFPDGISTALAGSTKQFPVRFWVVDNSGSMNSMDGQRLVTDGAGNGRMVGSTRWAELGDAVNAQGDLACQLGARTDFHLLNANSATAAQYLTLAKFGGVGGGGGRGSADMYPAAMSIGQVGADAGPAELKAAMDTSPNYRTPLTEHAMQIHSLIAPCADQLRAAGQQVVVVFATDGMPNDAKSFEQALVALQQLPVFIVIRLCTQEDDVTDYYGDLDKHLERPLEVLDDIKGEAKEIAQHNDWLVYGPGLHQAREFGLKEKLFDLLDERPLLASQMKQLVELILGCGPLPHPELDWSAFEKQLRALLAETPQTFNAITGRFSPWFDLAKLADRFAPRLALKMRGVKLAKVDMFSKSDPFVRVKLAGSDEELAKTEVIDNNHNPQWKELLVPGTKLQSDANLTFEVLDDGGKLIGQATAALHDLITGGCKQLVLKKDGKGGRGDLVFDSAAMNN